MDMFIMKSSCGGSLPGHSVVTLVVVAVATGYGFLQLCVTYCLPSHCSGCVRFLSHEEVLLIKTFLL
jgi:hypothetical protein